MKNVLFLTCLLLAGTSAFSQTTHNSSAATFRREKGKMLLAHILRQQSESKSPAARTTATRERLIGQSEYLPGMQLDSVALKYNGQRGSTFNLEIMSYGVGNFPGFITRGTDNPFGYSNATGQQFPHNQASSALCDTMKIWSIMPVIFPFVYAHFGTESHTYDAAGNLTDNMFIGDIGVIWQRDISTFNSFSNVTSIMEFTENALTGGLPWDSSYFDVLTYNSANQLVSDSLSSYDSYPSPPLWTPESKFVYTYNTAGDLVFCQTYAFSSGWVPDGLYTFTYYPGTHQLKTFESDVYPVGSTVLAPNDRDSFGYTPGISYSTYSNHREYASGTFNDMTIATRHINAAGLPDTVYANEYYTSATPQMSTKSVWLYDTYGNPITNTNYTDTATTTPTTFASKFYFYYETYNTSGISSLSQFANDVIIAPNPASQAVHILIPQDMEAMVGSYDIVNAQGQVLSRNIPANHAQQQEIPIARLPSGKYWIRIKDEQQNVICIRQVVKLEAR